MVLRGFQRRPRRVQNMLKVTMAITLIGLAIVLIYTNSEDHRSTRSIRLPMDHEVENVGRLPLSDYEEGWSPIDNVWSDAMSNGSFYMESRDNVSIVLWKPGMNVTSERRPFLRKSSSRNSPQESQQVGPASNKKPVPKSSGKSGSSAKEAKKQVNLEEIQKHFSLAKASKRFGKTSSSAWNNWPINVGALREIRQLAHGLHPMHGMDNREIRPNSKAVFTCRKGLKGHQSCQLDGHNAIRHYNTCAIVGNSGILTDSLCGSEIDAHDYVIRFSIGPIVGFEHDVGTKRNITFLNKDILRRINESLHLGGSKDVYSPRLKRMNASIFMFARGKRREWMKNVKCLVKIARKHKLAFTLKKNTGNLAVTIRNTITATMPDLVEDLGNIETTGMLALFMAATFCRRIGLYGFFPFQKDTHGRDIGYHYYPDDNVKPIVMDKIHNFSAEYVINRRFHQLGVVRHVIDKCQEAPLADHGSPVASRKLTSATGRKISAKKSKSKKTKDKRQVNGQKITYVFQ